MADRNSRPFVIELARIACDNKAEDILALDLRGVSPVCDYTVICSGTSDRQIRALSETILDYARRVGQRPYGVSGQAYARWVLIDFVDVVVHIFARPYRQYYDLELLWGDAPQIAWARSETA